MKQLMLAFLFISSISAGAAENFELRELYYSAIENEDSADVLHEKLSSVSSKSSAIEIGYKGMSCLLQAKHSNNPYSKYSYFKEGVALLDAAVVKDKNQLELRFFRLSVQENAPRFLGYYNEIEKDKDAIDGLMTKSKDEDLKNKIEKYLKQKK